MIARSVVIAVTIASSSLAFAASSAIGSVSTRGEINVGGYAVRGTATLFDNTSVETSDFAAILRLEKGTEIKLGAGSSSMLFHNRLVLSRGETQLTSATPFQIEANNLHISPSTSHSTGIVSMNSHNDVEVGALQGGLRVTDSNGALLAEVDPGASLSFPAEPRAQDSPAPPRPLHAPPESINDIGLLSFENGRFYLTSTLSGIKYEISRNGLSNYVGDKVVLSGTVLSGTAAEPVLVAVKSIGLNGGPTGMSTLGKILIGTSVAGEAAAIAYVVSAASR
jgi:hypothetical protein